MDTGALLPRLQLITRLLRPEFGMRVFALAVADVLAANRARLFMDTSGSLAAVVAAAGQLMILAHLFRAAALRAAVHTLAVAVLVPLAARASAIAAEVMRILAVGLAVHRVDARTVIRLAAGRFMAAEAPVAPELAAHAARGMRIGSIAQIGFSAAAESRIAVMLRIAFAGLVLRNSVAVLADNLVIMTAAGTGKVPLDAAGRQFMVPAVAADMARIPARRTYVDFAVVHAVAILAALGNRMLNAVTGIVSLRAADSRAVILAVAAIVAAGKHLMHHTVALQVTRYAAGRLGMVLPIDYAVALQAAGRLSMNFRLLAGIVAFSAAGRRQMLTAIAVEVAPDAAGSTIMVHAVTVKMALHPAGLGTVMVGTVKFLMARLLAGRLRRIIRRQSADRQHAAQKHNSQQHRQNLFQDVRLLVVSAPCADHNTLDILYNSCQRRVNARSSITSKI